MKRIKKFPVILLAAGILLVALSGCQTFMGGQGDAVATVINQTNYDLEVQKQGEYVTVLGRGDTYNLRGAGGRQLVRSITLVVLAYDEQGEYVGSAYRAFRERGFRVWEISSGTLSRPEDDRN